MTLVAPIGVFWKDRKIEGTMDGPTDRPTDWQADRPTDRQTDRPTDWQSDYNTTEDLKKKQEIFLRSYLAINRTFLQLTAYISLIYCPQICWPCMLTSYVGLKYWPRMLASYVDLKCFCNSFEFYTTWVQPRLCSFIRLEVMLVWRYRVFQVSCPDYKSTYLSPHRS